MRPNESNCPGGCLLNSEAPHSAKYSLSSELSSSLAFALTVANMNCKEMSAGEYGWGSLFFWFLSLGPLKGGSHFLTSAQGLHYPLWFAFTLPKLLLTSLLFNFIWIFSRTQPLFQSRALLRIHFTNEETHKI